MKRFLLLLLAFSLTANATRTFTDNVLMLGGGTLTNVDIGVDVDGSNVPTLRYNPTTDKWQISNDGTTFADITSATDLSTGLATKQNTLTNSAGLLGALSDETGTGFSVFSASPALTGSPTAPTQTASDNSTKISTTAYVDTANALNVKLAGSQTITGDKLITGQLTATSTTKGNRPCPVMTNAQMLAISSPSNGDCVINSTNADAIYTYSSTSSTWKVASGSGGGGGTRYELLTDQSFETGVTEGTCSGCTATSEGTNLPITPTNLKALKMAFTASTGSYTVDKAVTSFMLGADASVGAYVQTTAAGCFFDSRLNGADYDTTSKPILTDGYPHYYELPLVVGATSIGYKIDCRTSITGNVYVDETTVKLDKRLATLANVQNASDTVFPGTSTITGTASNPTKGTTTTDRIFWRRIGEYMELTFEYNQTGSGSAGSGDYLIAIPTGYTIDSTKTTFYSTAEGVGSWLGYATLGWGAFSAGSDSNPSIVLAYDSTRVRMLGVDQTQAGAWGSGYNALSGAVTASFKAMIPITGWTATNPNYLTAPDTFSTDYTPLTYASSAAYTSSTLTNAPVGTFITYTYATSSNTRVQTTSAPTQTTADMATNGILLYNKAYAGSASTFGNPAAISIQIGKNLKGLDLRIFKSAGKVTPGRVQGPDLSGGSYGFFFRDYEPSTGILYLDAGFNLSGSDPNSGWIMQDETTATSVYTVINASKNPALTGLNATPHPVAYVYDQKTSGTSAGTSAAGSQQRTLTGFTDSNSIGVSLASSKFTLPAGRYHAQCSVPAYGLGTGATASHKAKLTNDTDSLDVIIGTTSASVANSTTVSIIDGEINITSPKAFRIDHYTGASIANGLGLALGAYGIETYTQCAITKLSP